MHDKEPLDHEHRTEREQMERELWEEGKYDDAQAAIGDIIDALERLNAVCADLTLGPLTRRTRECMHTALQDPIDRFFRGHARNRILACLADATEL